MKFFRVELICMVILYPINRYMSYIQKRTRHHAASTGSSKFVLFLRDTVITGQFYVFSSALTKKGRRKSGKGGNRILFHSIVNAKETELAEITASSSCSPTIKPAGIKLTGYFRKNKTDFGDTMPNYMDALNDKLTFMPIFNVNIFYIYKKSYYAVMNTFNLQGSNFLRQCAMFYG